MKPWHGGEPTFLDRLFYDDWVGYPSRKQIRLGISMYLSLFAAIFLFIFALPMSVVCSKNPQHCPISWLK
jgi:hypothetical protein